MRKNQKGFTLVELIIAVAILAIVTLAVCGFIVVGSRSYTSANTDIMLQQEAQLALNQISDVIIDTTDSINYGNGTETVLKDSEFSSEPDAKILVVVNKKAGNNDNDSYRFEWSKADETIYFNTSSTVIDDTNPVPVFDGANRAILAQHVKELHIDISQFEENRVVMISMTFENGNREYTTSNNVTVRNRISLNKIDIDPMKKADEFTITTASDVTLEPGDSYNLGDIAITQIDTTSDDDAVIWELVDASTTTSSITADGQLTIGVNEERKSFQVRVRRVNEEYANQNNKIAKTIKVKIKRVTDVVLSCSETSIKAGSSVEVSGSANGNFLGDSCVAHSCLADDVNKDADLVSAISSDGWSIVEGPATIETSDTGKATIKISTTAKQGDKIVIQATSDLSVRKLYPTVTGLTTLIVDEGTTGAKPFLKEIEYATHYSTWLSDMTKYGYDDYVVCVRVRETDAADASKDQVILYHAEWGKSLKFCPDIFGLDLDRDYYMYFQIINPTDKDDARITQEYLDHTDSNGEYHGSYNASEFYGRRLVRPYIEGTPINQTYSFYVNGDKNMVGTVLTPIFDKGPLVQTPIHNIRPESAYSDNILRFAVYKEDENNPESWNRLYGVDEATGEYPSDSYILPGGDISVNLKTASFLAWHTGQWGQEIQNLPGACGTYHIVMGYAYKNEPKILTDLIGQEPFYMSDNVNRNYDIQYFEFRDCAATVKVDLGLNMELYPENGNKRLSNFPLPTDSDFPFEEKPGEQTASQTFNVYLGSSGEKIKTFYSVPVKCTYESDVYRIEFALGDWQTPKTDYVYTCAAGGDRWNLQYK